MKKGLFTFCAFVLLATQAPAANAAATTGGVSGDCNDNPFKSIQVYKYKTIELNKYFYNWNSVSDFIKNNKGISVDVKVLEKGTEVKENVSKGTEEKTPVSEAKANQTTEAKQKVTEVKTPEATTESNQKVTEAKTPEATTESNQKVTEVKTPEATTEAKQKVTEVEKTPEVKTEQPKASETTPTQSNTTQSNTTQSTTKASSNSSDIDAIEAKVVELTNAERVKAGLQPLKTYEPLMNSARIKSQDMKDKNYFSHTSPTYGSPQ